MTSSLSVAARLSPDTRKHFAIQTLAGNESISRIAVREQVSRKFLHHQKRKAEAALD